MIDPKINLRISPRTDLGLLTLASELTRKGLGFPQYSNDAVVIPGLAAHGYRLEDARDYGIAACWEFLIPGRGMEVVNIGTAFASKGYDPNGRFVPYELKIQGQVIKHNVALKKDEKTGRWYVDGGGF